MLLCCYYEPMLAELRAFFMLERFMLFPRQRSHYLWTVSNTCCLELLLAAKNKFMNSLLCYLCQETHPRPVCHCFILNQRHTYFKATAIN